MLKAFVHYTMRKCNKVIVQKKIFFHDFFSLSEVTTRYKYNRSQYCSVMLLSRHYTSCFSIMSLNMFVSVICYSYGSKLLTKGKKIKLFRIRTKEFIGRLAKTHS